VKTCTKCNRTLPLSEFYRKAQKRGGVDSWCKQCKKTDALRWYRSNRERALQAQRRYYEEHYEAIREVTDGQSLALYHHDQAQTLDHATRRGCTWTRREEDLILREDLTARQAALMLGRTHAAVRRRRQLLRGED
jgi:hypothetical protein